MDDITHNDDAAFEQELQKLRSLVVSLKDIDSVHIKSADRNKVLESLNRIEKIMLLPKDTHSFNPEVTVAHKSEPLRRFLKISNTLRAQLENSHLRVTSLEEANAILLNQIHPFLKVLNCILARSEQEQQPLAAQQQGHYSFKQGGTATPPKSPAKASPRSPSSHKKKHKPRKPN